MLGMVLALWLMSENILSRETSWRVVRCKAVEAPTAQGPDGLRVKAGVLAVCVGLHGSMHPCICAAKEMLESHTEVDGKHEEMDGTVPAAQRVFHSIC